MNNFRELQALILDFVKERNWTSFHNPKNLAMSISIEAAELMEQFQWLSLEESNQKLQDSVMKSQVEDEIADVLIYALSFANAANIDLKQAILNKIEKNRIKYPVD